MANKDNQQFIQACGDIKDRCDACGQEKAYCNTYMTADNRTITICPSCFVWGNSQICKDARRADRENRRLADEKDECLAAMRRKKVV